MSIDFDDENRVIVVMTLYDAVARLSPKQRIVVALISAGYNRTESGSILGLTRQAAGATYKRALKKIRELMENDYATST